MTDLLSWTPPDSDRHGKTYVREFDEARLNAQCRRVYELMADKNWRSLAEISAATGDPEASVSARLRDLRNMHGCAVERRRRGEGRGTHEYRLAWHP